MFPFVGLLHGTAKVEAGSLPRAPPASTGRGVIGGWGRQAGGRAVEGRWNHGHCPTTRRERRRDGGPVVSTKILSASSSRDIAASSALGLASASFAKTDGAYVVPVFA